MKRTSLSGWLKFSIADIGICVLILYALVIPMLGQAVAYAENGVYDYCYRPWLIFLWMTAIPVFIALAFAWKAAVNIGTNQAFSHSDAKLLKGISALAAGDSAFFFAGNIVLLFLNMNHPGIVLLSLLIVFSGIAVAIAFGVLSRLISRRHP
ncbi:MAG: DUF2975 domain-containing protein [Eubacteriales bacterium]|nr:DUF2975 domain-containing protein [Eubacteriales bacterium]